MADTTPDTPIDLSTVIRPRSLALLLARCALLSALLLIGFGGLAFLHQAQRVATRQLRADDEALSKAAVEAFICQPPLICLILLSECVILLLVVYRWPWPVCQVVPALLMALAGAVLGGLLFECDPGPKQTMLVTGSALLMFVAGSVQLALWQFATAPKQLSVDFPFAWYVLVLLLGATFFGAMRGWTDVSPHLQRLLDYRTREWAKNKPHPPLDLPQEERWPPSSRRRGKTGFQLRRGGSLAIRPREQLYRRKPADIGFVYPKIKQ